MKYQLKPILLAITSTVIANQSIAAELQPIVVEADFRPTNIDATSSSVSVISAVEAEQIGATHMENLINNVPNLNGSSGASRQKYFQIRGIGERSQFEYPVNPSVGLIIDGMNFSHTGSAATLFDTEQVEILRGPQGTRFGANALAGIINIQSKEATNTPEHEVSMTYGNFNTSSLGVVTSGPIIKDQLLGRIAIQQHRSDGYIENKYLDRSNTQDQNEITAKAHLKIIASDKHTIDLRMTHIDINNGYDGFAWDNNGFNTLSDNPGEDKLKSNAFALKSEYKLNNQTNMVTKLSRVQSESVYSFDADWVYPEYAGGSPQYFGDLRRNKANSALELNWLSSENGKILGNTTDWVFGVYASDYDEDLTDRSSYSSNEKYDLTTNTRAAFGQLDINLSAKTVLTTGLRLESYKAKLKTNTGVNEDQNEMLYGGKIGLSHQSSDVNQFFGSFSRGYKAGGINVDPNLSANDLPYETEFMWALEAGVNSKFSKSFSTRINLFYAKRVDQQVKSSYQPEPSNPALYDDYFTNAALGETYGIEALGNWKPNSNLSLSSSLGLLSNTFIDYENQEVGNKSGRDQAHSPNYQLSLLANFEINQNWQAMVNFQRKDSFYFSDSHNFKSEAYSLINTSLEYYNNDLALNFWVRNLTNTEYDVRGFDIGGELYTQKGEPRTFGVTARYSF